MLIIDTIFLVGLWVKTKLYTKKKICSPGRVLSFILKDDGEHSKFKYKKNT